MPDTELPVLEFYLAPDWDVFGVHRVYVKAPEDWPHMSQEERDRFMEQEAKQCRDERIEIGWAVHDTLDAAKKANRRGYGNKPDEVDEWF